MKQSKQKSERLSIHNFIDNQKINYKPNIIKTHNILKNKSNIYNISDIDRYNDFCENIIPTLPKEVKEDNSIKYLLNFHGGKNTYSNIKEFKIPKNFYIISLEKGGLIYPSIILDYLFFKIGMLNNISNELFKNITEEILFIESHMINSEYINNIEEKHFRLYKPGSKFYNYSIEN